MTTFGLKGLPLLTAEQSRALDQAVSAELNLTGNALMELASIAIFEAICAWRPKLNAISVFCGTGNNGGDGWVIARLALEAGWDVQVEMVGDPGRIGGDAENAYAAFLQAGGLIAPSPLSLEALTEQDVIVDAILGTGLRGAVRDHHQVAIDRINASHGTVVSVDCPSGLCGDSGSALPRAVRADLTLTVIAPKRGLYTGDAVDCVGQLKYLPVVSAEPQINALDPKAELLELALHDGHADRHVELGLVRARNSHKGHFGRILVVAGNTGMAGAAILTSEAALRSGAGLVSVASRADTVMALLQRRPEVMAHEVTQAAELTRLLQMAEVVIVGPGLGRDDWAAGLLGQVLDAELPTVIDADALHLLPSLTQNQPLHKNCVLTPHPGEAAALLNLSTRDVMADRFAASRALARRFSTVTVLKGAGTVITEASGERVAICPYGNAGMATAGSGDVLAGVIGTLLAQTGSAAHAAALGCCLHAMAGDTVATERGMAGLVAGDLVDALGPLVDALTTA